MTTGCTHVCIVGPLPLIVVAAVSLAAQSSSEAELVGRTRSSRRQRADAAAALLEDKVACDGGAGAHTERVSLGLLRIPLALQYVVGRQVGNDCRDSWRGRAVRLYAHSHDWVVWFGGCGQKAGRRVSAGLLPSQKVHCGTR